MQFSDMGDFYEDAFINNRVLSVQNTANYMYAKVTEVFHYDGLPLTIPKRVLEGIVTRSGAAIVYEYDGELFVTDQMPHDKANLYQEDTEVVIRHKVGDVDERLTRVVGVDAVMVRNDAFCIGLEPIITEFSIMSAQAKITMMRNLVDLRGNYIIQAKDENSYRSALEYERAVRRGDTAVIMAEEFDAMEGLVVHSTPISNNPATQTIELFQYMQSYYYSELGIELNNNMKREYVSDTEIEKSSGMPLIHNMLSMRQEAMRDIASLFGVEITVSLSSEWRDEPEEDDVTSMGTAEEPVGEPTEATEEPVEEPVEEQDGESDPRNDDGSAVVEPEVEEASEEELIEATEALVGEEVERHDEEDDDDSEADDSDSESDRAEDEA